MNRQSKRQIALQNLEKAQANRPPQGPNHKHGGYALFRALKQGRKMDRRTREAKQYEIVRQSYIESAGGPGAMNPALWSLLDANILPKVMVIYKVSEYAMAQKNMFKEDGSLIPCLGRNYISFSEALRRDIEVFYAFVGKRAPEVPSLADYLKALEARDRRLPNRYRDERMRKDVKGMQGDQEHSEVRSKNVEAEQAGPQDCKGNKDEQEIP